MNITGSRVRELRKANHMTQEELGSRIGVNGSAIGKYERGLLDLNLSKIKDIAIVFGVSPVYLIGATSDKYYSVTSNETIRAINEILPTLSLHNQEVVLSIVTAMFESEHK